MAQPFDVHVVTHTHWDREWYHSAVHFRQRLVALVDELLDAPPPAGESFLLDGQTVVLEDYLAVRPERAGELAALLRAGALEAGPWFVLADELLAGGEALVRNLLAGRRTLRALRAEAPPVLYSPDAFGHPAALPLLARGFACPLVILWRGYGGARWPAGDAARWRCDGAEVVLLHLPPDGYEFGSSLPTDAAAAAERWSRMRGVLAPRSRLGVLLVQNGADHHARQARHDEALAAMRRAAQPDIVHASSLRRVAEAALRAAAGAPLPVVEGELRDSYGYTWTLQGTFAARAHQKRRNARVERLLVRDAEPWAALAWRRVARSRRSLTNAAWRSLLLCHPHDTLCGTSTDEVARAMDARLDEAESQAVGLRDDALMDLLGHDPGAAREARERWRDALVVRNRAARPRGGVAEVELLRFLQDIPVGPRSGGVRVRRHRAATPSIGAAPVQVLGRQVRNDRVESPRHYPDNDLLEAVRAVAWLSPVAGYGTVSYPIGTAKGRGASGLPGGVAPARGRGRTIENGLLAVTVDGRGRVTLRAGGRVVRDAVRFEDVRDAGDLYAASPRGRVRATERCTDVRLVHRGPLRAELETSWRVALAGGARGASRADVRVRLTLDAGANHVGIDVDGENRTPDHRLRILLGTDVRGGDVLADAAFGPVPRAPIVASRDDRKMETPPPTAPLHRWVARFDERAGATLVSDGLAEYEAAADGAFAVTLVRAVGELSRNDLPERPGHAGWPVPVPEAQCLGAFAGRFALLLHGPLEDQVLDHIERAADDVLLPLEGLTLRAALSLPPPSTGAELDGDGLAFSTLKESDDGEWVVARCVNVLDRPARGRWRFGFPIQDARLARLDESPEATITFDASTVAFEAPARGVVTVLVR